MQTEKIQSRIQACTAGLTPAVQAGNGAEFSLLLSMISVHQQQYQPAPLVASADAQALRLPAAGYPDPNAFYGEALAERLNDAVQASSRGEFAMLCSYVDVASRTPRQPRQPRLAADQFEQVALMSSGHLMLNQIAESRQQLSA
jgi:hypothetical protein